MFPIYHIKEKEDKQERIQTKKDILLPKINDGLSREQIHDGITGSESCLQDMKRRLRTTLDWCIYHAVSLFIER